MTSNDYIELTDPKEVIREGDEITIGSLSWKSVRPSWAGTQVGEHSTGFRFRRPRSTVIRDAAEALLRAQYQRALRSLNDQTGEKYEAIMPEAKALRIALGLTVEELRGEK